MTAVKYIVSYFPRHATVIERSSYFIVERLAYLEPGDDEGDKTIKKAAQRNKE